MALPGCDEIAGQAFRPLFGQEMSAGQLEALILQVQELSPKDLQRRQDRGLFCLDWQKDGIWYTAGLQNKTLLFVNLRIEPGRLPASHVIACLGSPQWYQAWYDAYPGLGASSVNVALVFSKRTAIAYASQYATSAPPQAPAIDDRLPVVLINIFGPGWDEGAQGKSKSRPWPGDWKDIQIETTLHGSVATSGDRDQNVDALPASSVEPVLDQIDQAFAGAPRPPDDQLLHPDARDDGDIQALIGVPHWRDLPETSVEYEYSALAFLSPAGFRHFLPAYMSWVLRHPDSSAAVVGSTIFALAPGFEEPLRGFMLSKFSLFDAAQRAAVVSFLRVMANFEDVRAALDYWDPHSA